MNKKAKLKELNALDPVKLVEADFVKSNFIETYANTHGAGENEAANVYSRESMYYKKVVSGDSKLKQCTRLSLYSVFMELAIIGLSIQPGQKSEAYLEARGVKTGGDRQNPQYTQTAFLRITAYGELNLRIMSGQIKRMFNPVVLYEGDHFQPMTNDKGELFVDYKPQIPRKSKKVFGCYVRILLPDGTSDFKWILEDDVERLKGYATIKTRNGSYTNPLYSSANGGIDPGFLEAKTIKHAMRAYTKLRVGENVVMEDENNLEESQAKPFGEERPDQEPQPEAPKQETKVQINADEPF